MPDILSTSTSALLAFQNAIATTSHNVANVNTEGYSRQQVDFNARQPERFGDMYIGTGVDANSIKRNYDDFLTSQLRNTTSSYGQMDTYATLASSMDNLFGSSQSSLSPMFSQFFNDIEAVSSNPAATPERQTLLSDASALTNRFQTLDAQLGQLDQQTNGQITSSVKDINQLSSTVADLNRQITAAQNSTAGAPNDLLDQRDQAIKQLAGLVSVQTMPQSDGAMNVFIGNGQSLVVGDKPMQLTTVANAYDPQRLEVAYGGPQGPLISDGITGGQLGGTLAFRREMLDPAHNQLGLLAQGFSASFNDQHQAGMDLQGNQGAAFFAAGAPQVLPSQRNIGDATVAVQIGDASALTASDYQLRYDGSQWQLTRLSDGTTSANSGPLQMDGMTITPSTGANAGDSFLIRPTHEAAGGMQVLIDDPSRIAAAAPLRTQAATSNSGNASISAGTVLDPQNDNLRQNVSIQFLSANTYSVNGSGSYAYTSGGNISLNGWQVQISGNPQPGDQFSIQGNTGGVGDNRNAAALSNLQNQGILNNGTATYQQAYGSLVSNVATRTKQSQDGRDAQQVLNQQAQATRDATSGVNLDEEAANLIRFQQAYQAAAQSITTANTMFQTLLSAIRS
jgi:flagellar hook-associated protein 1 FlgK